MGKKRFFNFKNLFFVSFLAVAGIFSATAIVKNKQVEDISAAEKADADSTWCHMWYTGCSEQANAVALGGNLWAFYSISLAGSQDIYFNFPHSGGTFNYTSDSNIVGYPGGWVGGKDGNFCYYGTARTVDIIVSLQDSKFLMTDAQGYNSITFDCSNLSYTPNKLHIWDTAHSNFGTNWSNRISISLSNKKVTKELPKCFNKFILASTSQTGDLTLSTLNGDVGTIASDGKSVSWLSSTGVFLVGSCNDWKINSSFKFSNHSSTFKKLTYTMSQNVSFKVYYNGNWRGDDYTFIHNDTTECFDISHDYSDNNITCSTAGTYDFIFNTDSNHPTLYIYKSAIPNSSGYYLIGNNGSDGFGYWSLTSATRMTPGAGGDANLAYLEYDSGRGKPITNGTEFKIIYFDGVSSVIYYNIYSAGGTYVSEEWSFDGGTASYSGSGGRFNFYLKAVSGGGYTSDVENYDGSTDFYIVDVGQIDALGYLYYASTQSNPSNISLVSSDSTTSTTALSTTLDQITGLESVTRICKFDSLTSDTGGITIYRFPIFNLRGSNASVAVNQVAWNDGVATTVTGIPTTGNSEPHYYARSGTATIANGNAALAVFEIADAINKATSSSVCNISKQQAQTLKGYYDDASSSALLTGAKLYTYTSSIPSSLGPVDITSIYVRICDRASGSNSAIRNFTPLSLFGEDENSIFTIIIIVASSLSLLSITALSVLLVKKRKRKED